MSLFKPVSQADLEGKKRIYADPEFRRAFKERGDQGGKGVEDHEHGGRLDHRARSREDCFGSLQLEDAIVGRRTAPASICT